MKNNKDITENNRIALLRASRAHYLLVALLISQIIIYDAGDVIIPEVLLQRWAAATGLMLVTSYVWYRVRSARTSASQAARLAYLLIVADIALATFYVYTQRGMASRAVILYAIPLTVALVLRSRRAIYGTVALAVTAYTTAAISYFVLNFNEGYKIELYGEIGFYSAVLFILAGLLWNVLRRPSKDTRQ